MSLPSRKQPDSTKSSLSCNVCTYWCLQILKRNSFVIPFLAKVTNGFGENWQNGIRASGLLCTRESSRAVACGQYWSCSREAAFFWAVSRWRGVWVDDGDFCRYTPSASWPIRVCWCFAPLGRSTLYDQKRLSLIVQVSEVCLWVGSSIPTETTACRFVNSFDKRFIQRAFVVGAFVTSGFGKESFSTMQ